MATQTPLLDCFTKAQLAQALGVSPRTIDRWHCLGFGPKRAKIQRQILYRREAVETWLRQREELGSDAGGGHAS